MLIFFDTLASYCIFYFFCCSFNLMVRIPSTEQKNSCEFWIYVQSFTIKSFFKLQSRFSSDLQNFKNLETLSLSESIDAFRGTASKKCFSNLMRLPFYFCWKLPFTSSCSTLCTHRGSFIKHAYSRKLSHLLRMYGISSHTTPGLRSCV